MGKLHITILNDTVQCVAKIKHAIWQRFGFDCRLEQRSASMLVFQMPETYSWTREDADFMNNLTDQHDWIAGWRYWPLSTSQTERTTTTMSNSELIKAERCAVHLDKIPRLATDAKEELRKRGANNAFLALVADIEAEARHIREYIESNEKDDMNKKGQ